MHFNYKIFKKVFLIALLIFSITLIGMIGYMYFEGWSAFDSFYMTVITMSTVGYGEVHPMTNNGRLFTTMLIMSGFGIFALAVTTFTNYLVDGEYRRHYRDFKAFQKIRKMKQHVVICGYGRVGMQVAEELDAVNQPFIVIERLESAILSSNTKLSGTFLFGDATSDEILKKANIDHAKAIISCLPLDTDNVYVVLSAKELNPDLQIVSRASSQSSVTKLKMAGATNVIMPDSIGGTHMASLITNPLVAEFMDRIKTQGKNAVNIESISFLDLPQELHNKTIGELEAKKQTGVTIIGFQNSAGEFFVNPDVNIKVEPNCQLFVLGTAVQIQQLNSLYGLSN